MLSGIITKIRALIEDLSKTKTDSFEYRTSMTSKIFTLTEENVSSITDVKINGSDLVSGQSYSFDSDKVQVTLIADLSDKDIITIKYPYYKYSDTELIEFTRASLAWISVYSDEPGDYELEDTSISPTPDNRTTDLIAIIASILIKPNYSEYRLPHLTVRYPRTMDKEEKIKNLVDKFNLGLGIGYILEIEN